MPSVYLSPSTDEQHKIAGGSNEEYYMNLIVDAMMPYLRVSGIDFMRNDPGLSSSEIIERSNDFMPNLHLALRTQDTPKGLTDDYRGINAKYYTYSHVGGDNAAAIFGENLMEIYPAPSLVHLLPDRNEWELVYTDAPAVVLELGNRENIQDAQWLRDNVPIIAKNLSQSVAQFLQVPFIPPFEQIPTPS